LKIFRKAKALESYQHADIYSTLIVLMVGLNLKCKNQFTSAHFAMVKYQLKKLNRPF